MVQPKLCEPQESEEILFDQEATWGEESRKKNLALKVKEMMRLFSFIYMFVLVEIENGLQYIYPI